MNFCESSYVRIYVLEGIFRTLRYQLESSNPGYNKLVAAVKVSNKLVAAVSIFNKLATTTASSSTTV